MTPADFRKARHALGLSAQAMAFALGVSDGRTIRRWESGENPIGGPVERLVERMLADRSLLDQWEQLPEWLMADARDDSQFVIHSHYPRFVALIDDLDSEVAAQAAEDGQHLESHATKNGWLLLPWVWLDAPPDLPSEREALMDRADDAIALDWIAAERENAEDE